MARGQRHHDRHTAGNGGSSLSAALEASAVRPLLGNVAELERALNSSHHELALELCALRMESEFRPDLHEAILALCEMIEVMGAHEALNLLGYMGERSKWNVQGQLLVLHAYAQQYDVNLLTQIEPLMHILPAAQAPTSAAPAASDALELITILSCYQVYLTGRVCKPSDQPKRLLAALETTRRRAGEFANTAFIQLALQPTDPTLLESATYRGRVIHLTKSLLDAAGDTMQPQLSQRQQAITDMFEGGLAELQRAARFVAIADETRRLLHEHVPEAKLKVVLGGSGHVWGSQRFPDTRLEYTVDTDRAEQTLGAEQLVKGREAEWWLLKDEIRLFDRPLLTERASSGQELISRALRVIHEPHLLVIRGQAVFPSPETTIRMNTLATGAAAAELVCDPRMAGNFTYREPSITSSSRKQACIDVRILGSEGSSMLLRVIVFDGDFADLHRELIERKSPDLINEGGISQSSLQMEIAPPLISTRVPTKSGVDASSLLLPQACVHPHGEWVPDQPSPDRLRLRCGECARERIAVVWRHQLPMDHPQAVQSQVSPKYLLTQRLRLAALGCRWDTSVPLDLAALRALDGEINLDPSQHIDYHDPLLSPVAAGNQPPSRRPRRLRA